MAFSWLACVCFSRARIVGTQPDGLENLKCYGRYYRVPVGFYGFVAVLRNGNSNQSTGNPIISATNRGLSWEVVPSGAFTAACIAWASVSLCRLASLRVHPPFASLLAVGVGSRFR